MDKKIKQRLGDGKINTSFEMIENLEEKLWESNPMEALRHERIETRKKLNWWARFTLSMIIVFTFLFLVWLLFFGSLPATVAGLINIKTKNKLREEAEILHFMPKTSKLPI